MTMLTGEKILPREDVRRERTRKRLEDAVLELASERDITTASVSELTRRAGVVRTTFYAHADTPMKLLTGVLSRELDAVREALLRELSTKNDRGGFRELTRRTLGLVIDHVIRHEAVYASTNSASSAYALRAVLAEHIASSVYLILDGGYVDTPSSKPEDLEIYATILAHGAAAAVELWLRRPKPRSRDALLSAIAAVHPAWYS
jgi:AcrR family transcriptional regulator